jgi:hypothetical protein
MPRPDGITTGVDMLQGVRAFDVLSGVWTTPDFYPADLSNPMTLKSYMWNGNNPISNQDPSGYSSTSCSGHQFWDWNTQDCEDTISFAGFGWPVGFAPFAVIPQVQGGGSPCAGNPPNALPHGFGMFVTGEGTLGLGGVASAQGSAGVASFGNPLNPSPGFFATGGVGGPDGPEGYPSQGNAYGGGASVGGGLGMFITNAGGSNQFGGPFTGYSLNTPIASANFSTAGPVWSASLSAGVSSGFSVSRIVTNTAFGAHFGC